MKRETLTLVLVNLAGIMERADEALLPGVYQEVGAALHTDPTGLGSLTLFRSIVQSCCYPIAAYLALHHNRAHVIALGAFVWSAATFLVAFSTTFFQVAISRGLNGVGLAIVIPAIQSLVADSSHESNRGTAFGWLQLTSNLGSIVGGLCSVLLAPTTLMGIPGWRLSFHLVGLISVVVGILVHLYAHDPHFSDGCSKGVEGKSSMWSEMKNMVMEAKSVIKIPTFQVIVAQGITGSFAGSAFSFFAMWLELVGFSHRQTAFILSLFAIAVSVGGLFGGKMGDFLAGHFPNGGRIVLSQISSGSAIPLAAILLLVLPADPSTVFTHGLLFFIMGLCISWNAPATNNPIFAEIVPDKSRTSVYAFDNSFESILASLAPPIVGLLAQHVYGYKPVPEGSSASQEIATDRENAASLAKALYTCIGVPMALCCTIYSFLYCTYPRDRDIARMAALTNSDIQQDQIHLQESHDLDNEYTSVTEIEYDDSDKKMLLSSRDLDI